MNKIFRKSGDFGLMVRLNCTLENSLATVESFIKGNIPLVLIDIKINDSIKILKNISTNADLFIAAENIETIEEAFDAVSNGAQFFIIDGTKSKLMDELKNYGLFYIPSFRTIPKDFNNECICVNSLTQDTESIPYVIDNSNYKLNSSIVQKSLFTIINQPLEVNLTQWINSQVKEYLGLEYYKVCISKSASKEQLDFATVFAATNKCFIEEGPSNVLFLRTINFEKSVSYLKWKEIYFNPVESDIINNRVIRAPLDKKLLDFEIILEETK